MRNSFILQTFHALFQKYKEYMGSITAPQMVATQTLISGLSTSICPRVLCPYFFLDGTLFWLCFRVIVFCLLFLVFDIIRDPPILTERPISRFPFASWEFIIYSKKNRRKFQNNDYFPPSSTSVAERNMAWTFPCSFCGSRRDFIFTIKLGALFNKKTTNRRRSQM